MLLLPSIRRLGHCTPVDFNSKNKNKKLAAEMAAGSLSVKPIKKPSGSAIDIGVEIEGADIENLTGKYITCYILRTIAKFAQM